MVELRKIFDVLSIDCTLDLSVMCEKVSIGMQLKKVLVINKQRE